MAHGTPEPQVENPVMQHSSSGLLHGVGFKCFPGPYSALAISVLMLDFARPRKLYKEKLAWPLDSGRCLLLFVMRCE